MRGILKDDDHERLDGFLAEVFVAAKVGTIAQSDFIEGMAYVMTALDVANRDEALRCIRQGTRHFNLEPSHRAAKIALVKPAIQSADCALVDPPRLRRQA